MMTGVVRKAGVPRTLAETQRSAERGNRYSVIMTFGRAAVPDGNLPPHPLHKTLRRNRLSGS